MRLRELERQLGCHGFTLSRIKGSHRVYRSASGQVLVIAAHNSGHMFSHNEMVRIWSTIRQLLAAADDRREAS